MALREVHVVGDAHGIPVRDLGTFSEAVPKGWLFGECGVHPYCFLFKPPPSRFDDPGEEDSPR